MFKKRIDTDEAIICYLKNEAAADSLLLVLGVFVYYRGLIPAKSFKCTVVGLNNSKQHFFFFFKKELM